MQKTKLLLTLLLLVSFAYTQSCTDDGTPIAPCNGCQKNEEVGDADTWVKSKIEILEFDDYHDYSHLDYFDSIATEEEYPEKQGTPEIFGMYGWKAKVAEDIWDNVLAAFYFYYTLLDPKKYGKVSEKYKLVWNGGTKSKWDRRQTYCPDGKYLKYAQVYTTDKFSTHNIISCLNLKCEDDDTVYSLGNCIGNASPWYGDEDSLLAGVGVKHIDPKGTFITGITFGFISKVQKWGCEGCQTGGYLNYQSCSICLPSCSSCENAYECTGCADPKKSAPKCNECKEGYFEYKGKCYKIPDEENENNETEEQSHKNTEGKQEYVDGNNGSNSNNHKEKHTCGYKCATCDAAGICTSCIQPEARFPLDCDCAEGFYEKDKQCFECVYGCAECENGEECIRCKSDLRTGKTCEDCVEGYFFNGKYCEECMEQCATCDSPNSCLTCVGEMENRHPSNCLCNPGYSEFEGKCLEKKFCSTATVENEQGFCQICDISCYDCTKQTENFTGCSTSCHVCPPKPPAPQPQKEGCPKLIEENCKEVEVNCVKCKDESMENRSEDCKCLEGFYDYKGEKCHPCKESCKTCENAEKCTACPEGSGKVIDEMTGGCVCKPEFYEDAQGVCQPCESECNQCISKDTCVKCYDANKLLPSCKECKSGYFLNGDVCEKCSENCKECENQNKCSECPEGRELQGGECVCKSGSYPIDLVKCGACPLKCPDCSGPESCDVCEGNRDINKNCECAEDELDIPGQDCQKCNKKCKGCVENTETCVECSDPMRIYEKECACPEGTTTGPDGSSCIPCTNPDCKHCDKNIDQCSACYGTERSGDQCKCYPGKFEVGQDECSQCNVKCETCTESSDNCVTCKDPDNRSPPSCECEEGLWDDNGVCKPQEVCTKIEIQASQQVCNAFKISCDICLEETELKCMPACKNGICSQSDLEAYEQCAAQNCKVSPPEKCDEDTSACVCDPGFYQVAEDRNDCWPCHYSCETCDGGSDNNCLSCKNGEFPAEGKCENNEINVNDDPILKQKEEEQQQQTGLDESSQPPVEEEPVLAQVHQGKSHMRKNL